MAWQEQIFTVAGWAAVAVAGWWVLGALLWAAALERQQARFTRTLNQLSLPGSRKLASAAVAVGVMTSAGCSSGGDDAPALVWIGEEDGEDQPDLPTTTATTVAPTIVTVEAQTEDDPTEDELTEEALPEEATPDDTVAGEPDEHPGEVHEHVVVPGDHLWGIAERTVLAATPTATPLEVASYWRTVIEHNRPNLRSGNPDLIHPGERIMLPALEG